jgi:hypothetical protein
MLVLQLHTPYGHTLIAKFISPSHPSRERDTDFTACQPPASTAITAQKANSN